MLTALPLTALPLWRRQDPGVRRIDDEEHLARSRALVRAPHYPPYMYGDELELEEKLHALPVLEDFPYRDDLAHREIHGIVG